MFAVLVGLGIAALVFGVTFVLPIVSFSRLQQVTRDIERLRARLDGLEASLRGLAGAAQDAPVVASPPSPVTPMMPVAPALPVAPAVPVAPAPLPVEPRPQPVAAPAAASYAAERAAGGRPEKAASPAVAEDTLETRIGGRWLLYIGTATLVLGIGFFVKYAFDNNWVNETGRVLLGALFGLVMVGGGHRIARRGYPLYGQIVAGGGFVALYIAAYAALNFYGLISRPAAFGLMVVITAAAAWAADLHRSQGLAFFAVVGGFLTPFLVGGTEDAQVVLLTYDAILVAGTVFMAERRSWPHLNIAAYALTALTFVGWAGEHYAPPKWVTTEVFLTVFALMFTGAAFRTRRASAESSDITSFVLFTAPLAYYFASVANLHTQPLALLVFLTFASLAGVVGGVRLDRPWLRFVAFVLVMPVLFVWIGAHTGPGWRLAPAVVFVAIYVMHLVGLGERLSRTQDAWLKLEIVLFHANALALFGGLYTIIDAVAPGYSPALALGLAVWHGALAWLLRKTSEDAALNGVAMAFAMLGFAIGLQFDDWWSVVGWAVESAAVIWVGLKSRRDWMRLGGALLFALTLFNLFMLGFFQTPSGFDPFFNARVGATLVVVAVCFGLAGLHRRFADQYADKATAEIATLWVGGNVLTILLISTEISFYWNIRETTDATADLARMASLSVAWATYGTALVVVGIVRRYAPIRYLAIALLALTIGKVFLIDLYTLGGIYRIIGFIGLGGFLLLGAWLYQKYRAVILGTDR
ncbi:MAG: DUF2339 domain-containing protein [Acidobacteria bacterium]|nr:DUF2339 domain-containing protein [Acidobacteriota bacterium]